MVIVYTFCLVNQYVHDLLAWLEVQITKLVIRALNIILGGDPVKVRQISLLVIGPPTVLHQPTAACNCSQSKHSFNEAQTMHAES